MRHLADHPSPEDAPLRLRHFLRLERERLPHPIARALHARRPSPPAETRLKPVLRILRGHEA